jgi:hypothetical protein
MRILNVGDFNWMSGRERHTANVDLFPIRSKLTNAAIRAGHFVAEYSDRAVARRASVWAGAGAGPKAARRGFLQMVDEVRPDLVLLHFADHIDPPTLAQARRLAPGVVLVDINIDPLPDPKTIQRLERLRGVVDATFVTTAGPGLKRFAGARGFVAFMPNPVDPAIETARAFEVDLPLVDLILPVGDDSPRHLGDGRRRPSQIAGDLGARLANLRLATPGLGSPRLRGLRYFEALQSARMGWALSRYSDQPWYASDRMAHMLGCGLLTLLDAKSGFRDVYTDDDVVFYQDLEDLSATLANLLGDDARARAMAQKGWEKTWAVFEVGRVFHYLLDQIYRDGGSAETAWPAQRWGRR